MTHVFPGLSKKAGWFYWLCGLIFLISIGVVATRLPLFVSLGILIISIAIGLILAKPFWILCALLLFRSSTDISQTLFTINLGGGFDFNAAGAMNILAFGTGIIVAIKSLMGGKTVLPSIPIKLFAAFLFVTGLGLLTSIDFASSLKEWSRFAGTLGIAIMVIAIVKTENLNRALLRLFTISALPPLILGYYQVLTGKGYYFEGAEGTLFAFRPQGTFGHPAILATFLAFIASLTTIAFIMDYKFWPKPILLGFAIVSAGLLVLTYARTEWIGALTAFAIISLLRYRKLAIVLIVIGCILVLAVPSIQSRISGENSSESLNWRLSVWKAALTILKEPTWLGTGLDTSPILINKQLPTVFSPPHNDYLRITIEGGIVGLAVFFLLYLSLLAYGWKSYQTSKLLPVKVIGFTILVTTIAGLVISLSDNYLGYTSFQWYFWALFASLVALNRLEQPIMEIKNE